MTTQTAGCSPAVVLSLACEPENTFRALEDQICCGARMQVFEIEGGRRVARCRLCSREMFERGQIHDARTPWIGVDLDGTLASDTSGELWDSQGNPKIGRPVEEMVTRIKRWIAAGQTIKIFTARASSPAQVSAIRVWLARRGLPDLEVTNVKDFNMIELWDDRCVQVAPNSGRPVAKPLKPRRTRLGSAGRSSSGRSGGVGFLFTLKHFLAL